MANVATCGRAVELSVADLVAHPYMGARAPALGDEVDHGGAWHSCCSARRAMRRCERRARRAWTTFRKVWEKYANGVATEHRGRFDTRLRGRF